MKIIGLCGEIGSGKDAFADYLVRKHKFVKLVMSNFVITEMNKNGISINRENTQNFSKEAKEKYGRGVWANLVINHIQDNMLRHVVVSGIRDSEEVKLFRQFGKDFMLVYVKADPHVRFERLKQRKTAKDLSTFEEFEAQERGESEKFDIYGKFETIADYTVTNNSSMVELYALAEDFLKKYKL